MKKITFDIETGTLLESEIMQFAPEFSAPSNYTDPVKIKAAVDNKRKAWLADAALDPMTGRVLAIGLLVEGSFVLVANDDEKALLLEFWKAVQSDLGNLHTLIGFNCNSFDLPFLIKRSWKRGVAVPAGIRRGRYWGDQIIDLRDVWQMGDRQAAGSLDTIAKHLGVGAKIGIGADFAALWASDREKAIAYLKNDLAITDAIAARLL